MYQTSSDGAVMTETAAININFSFRVADRAVQTWNNLPADSTDFSNLRSFKRGLHSSFLARHSAVYYF